jgi:antitoxin component YwqK of YwqJK toxin-antitoxin module
VNLNLGFVKAAYQKANIRANMALMVGTYANANLAPENGVLKKNIVYYNSKEKIVSDETFYYSNNRKVEKKIRYSSDHKRLWIKYFDESGNKKLEEEYNNGILTYSCPYLNNRKNGIVYSINENGEKNECKFVNGKLIKN